jgi:hypothetical protein
MVACAICSSVATNEYRSIDEVMFYRCTACESIFADPIFLNKVEQGTVTNYKNMYWESELRAAKERSFGGSLQRVAEVFFYSRIPIQRFVDIGSGPGYLLDSISSMLPASADKFYGVELFPPDIEFRSKHPNYIVGPIGNVEKKFDAGVCIEVIEHLTPAMLDGLAKQMAAVSSNKALYLINSGQPEYVIKEDPNYLDPLGRGHIVSYSLAGAEKIFGRHGFRVIPLPGRHWAFLLEYSTQKPQLSAIEELEARMWNPVPENKATLQTGARGELMYNVGLDSARCYLEHAMVMERTTWAVSLQEEVDSLRAALNMRRSRVTRQTIPTTARAKLIHRARRWWARHTS